MFDSHCHLDMPAFDADRAEVWAAARAAGVSDLLLPGYAPSGWARSAEIAHEFEGVHLALGIHPWALADLDLGGAGLQRVLDQLDASLGKGGICAVGECGLDAPHAKRAGVAAGLQRDALVAQLDLAERHALPIVLHVVGTHGAALELLQARGPLPHGGVLHSYSGSPELVPRYAELNLSFSFAAIVARSSARRPVAALRAVPADRLLLESDGPDQPLEGGGRSRSVPADLVQICEVAARHRGVSAESLGQLTASNARRLFTPQGAPRAGGGGLHAPRTPHAPGGRA